MSEENTTQAGNTTQDGNTTEVKDTEVKDTEVKDTEVKDTEVKDTKDDTVSDDTVSDDTVSDDTVSDNTKQGDDQDQKDSKDTSEEETTAPMKAEDYQAPDYIPQAIKEFAAESGLTQEQFDSLTKRLETTVKESSIKQRNALLEQGKQFIEKEWGDKADRNVAIAKQALSVADKDGKLRAMLDSTGFGSHPVVLEFFYNLGTGLQEGGYIKGANTTNVDKRSKAQKLFKNMN